MKFHHNNQLHTLKDEVPAEPRLCALPGSFPSAPTSCRPPGGSGKALLLKAYNTTLNEWIVNEIQGYPESVQIRAMNQMIEKLKKEYWYE